MRGCWAKSEVKMAKRKMIQNLNRRSTIQLVF